MTSTKLFSSILLAASLGCGGGGGGGADTGGGGGRDTGVVPDALVGTWFTQVTPVTADDQTQTVTFERAGGYTAVHEQTNPSTSTDHAGCVESVTETGTYAPNDERTMVTFFPSGDTGTREYAGCTDPAENGPGTPVSSVFFSMMATVPYSVSGDTLTLAGATFTRL